MYIYIATICRENTVLTKHYARSNPTYVYGMSPSGVLKVSAMRDHEPGRPVVRSRLLDETTGTEAEVLQELSDSRLLWVADAKLHLTDFERVDGWDGHVGTS